MQWPLTLPPPRADIPNVFIGDFVPKLRLEPKVVSNRALGSHSKWPRKNNLLFFCLFDITE